MKLTNSYLLTGGMDGILNVYILNTLKFEDTNVIIVNKTYRVVYKQIKSVDVIESNNTA